MFCLAARSDLATLDQISTDDATLQHNILSTWSSETKNLAIRLLDVLENEYISQSNKPELLDNIHDARAIIASKILLNCQLV